MSINPNIIFNIPNKYFLFSSIAIFLLAVLFFIGKTLGAGILLSLFLCLTGIFLINLQRDKKEAKLQTKIFLIALAVHLAAAFFIYYAHFQPFSDGRGDYMDYHIMAKAISERVHVGNFSLKNFPLSFGVSHYYPVIIGYIYAFSVPEMLIGQIFNSFLLAMTVLLAYLVMREIGRSEKESFWVSMIINLYPSMSFFGGLMLKDVMVVFFSALGLLLMIKTLKSFSWKNFLLFYVSLFGLTHFRFYISYALIGAFVISWLAFSAFGAKKRIIYGFLMVFLMGLLPQISGVEEGFFAVNSIKRYLNARTLTYYREVAYAPKNQKDPGLEAQTKPEDRKQIIPAGQFSSDNDENRNWGEDSSMVIKTGLGNPLLFIKNSFLSLCYAVLGPFPWQIKRLKHAFVLPEVIPWFFFFIIICAGIIGKVRQKYKEIIPLLLFAIFAIGGFALFITNFGIMTRIRMPGIFALLCLLPFGVEFLNETNLIKKLKRNFKKA